MSDHQFEKNVRKQMEELRFHPDASVWTAVEKRIAGKKQKRRGIIWIPVLLLLLTGGIFIIKNNQPFNTSLSTRPASISTDDQPAASAKTADNTPSPAPSGQKPDAIPHTNDQPNTSATAKHNVASNTQKKATLSPELKAVPVEQQPVYTDADVAALKKSSHKKVSGNTKEQAKIVGAVSATSVYKRERSDLNKSALKNVSPTDENVVTGNSTQSLKHSTIFAITVPDHDKNNLSVAAAFSPALAANHESNLAIVTKQWMTATRDSLSGVATTPPVERRKTKLQWGITVEAGFSNVTEGGLFDVTQKSMVQDVASNSFSSPLPANAVLPMPSDIRPAPALGAGVFIKQAVSKRIALSAGLGYSLLQTSIQVGQWTQANWMVLNARGPMDVGAVYRAGTQQQYNNQYHFVELPLEASFRLNKRKQYPIALTTGMIVGRLIKSNALHFDGATRVYYEDNSLFNKTQAGFSGGLTIGFLQRTAHPVTAGPFFHYRATSLMKYAVNGERHLLSFGMNVKVLMKK